MINVVIFALPMSSTIITFSGLTGVTLVAFGINPENYNLVTVHWIVFESLVWALSPIAGLVLTYVM